MALRPGHHRRAGSAPGALETARHFTPLIVSRKFGVKSDIAEIDAISYILGVPPPK